MKTDRFLSFPLNGLKRIIVLGAGFQLLVIDEFCRRQGIKLEIYTCERQIGIQLKSGEKLFDILRQRGCSVFVCDKLEAVEKGPFKTADNQTLVVSFGSPFIINQNLIDLYGGRIINSHGAPLPEFRGGGGLTWRFLAGDTRGSVLFHRVTTVIDDGAVLYRKNFEFPSDASAIKEWVVLDEIEQESGLNDFLSRLVLGEKFFDVEQDRSLLTYFPRLNTDRHGFIDFSWPGEMIERFIGAFSEPYSGASTFIGDCRIRVYSAKFIPNNDLQHPFLYGLIVRKHSGNYWVTCKGGVLKVPEGALTPSNTLKLGDRMYTPSNVIDRAFSERVVYTTKGIK